MAPHEERVVNEKKELDVKVAALRSFFTKEIYAELLEDDKTLLRSQERAMSLYSDILQMRIDRFAK